MIIFGVLASLVRVFVFIQKMSSESLKDVLQRRTVTPKSRNREKGASSKKL
jgi:hypothetical protein